MTIPRLEFASLDPVPAEVVLERLAEFQAKADEHDAEYEAKHEEAKAAKQAREKVMEEVSTLVRARKAGLAVRMLKGGRLTTEEPEPEKPVGPLFDGTATGGTPVEEPVPQAPSEPEDDPPLLIHKATGPNGEECIVKRSPDGKWWGRADGKPCAQGLLSSSSAKREVEKVVAGGLLLTWKAEPLQPEPPAV